ncbi:hypothetical protein E4U58_004034 [Claviceps cyperi]|nr:hypothetical protein E4U58_004034 [Claviceps cyperi]
MEQQQAAQRSIVVYTEPSTRERPATRQPWAHLLAGASGSLVTAVLISPLDVLRTRLQSDFYRSTKQASQVATTIQSSPKQIVRASVSHIHETLQLFKSIQYTEGWRGFFRGLGPSLAGVVPATAIKYYVYGNWKHLGAQLFNRPENDPLIHAHAAVAAGIITGTATNPIWLIKTRLQLDKTRTKTDVLLGGNPRNSLDCLVQVARTEGIRGLYRGLTASYLGTVETALHLVLYERLKVAIRYELGEDTATSGAAGSAKLAAVLMTYPHEVIRTRLRQAPLESGGPRYTGLIHCFKTVWRSEGLAGSYGGLTPHLRSIPSAMITLGVYEYVLRLCES